MTPTEMPDGRSIQSRRIYQKSHSEHLDKQVECALEARKDISINVKRKVKEVVFGSDAKGLPIPHTIDFVDIDSKVDSIDARRNEMIRDLKE